ncbi:DUF4373 domain-containing protein [Pediococcus stilesii]|uniref:DUF4373 domain-containing protein n=1 Tax=Pediococcus stilesii TaxID=331679 RepID=A0A5R9BXI3_9LACO|nr:DUF4373 domain-containing protein [Pediococcus stilesii]TLQ05444.1 DUF4373 domain-containing protein [Pediococcus stilesii]
MARPTKQGLDYFPFDVDLFSDPVIEMVSGKYEAKGELAVVKLLNEIYRQNGYYLEWNELTAGQLQKRVPGASAGMIEQIVGLLVKWNYFDSKLFDSEKVLTSAHIQEVYFEATKRRKSTRPTKYVINVNNNSTSKEVNVDINAQSKVKESKVKKSKDKKPPAYADDSPYIILSRSLYSKMKANNPTMKKVTDKEFNSKMQKWANTMRLAVERDGRTVEQLQKAINWSQNHEFWSGVILSADSLRQKFDTMSVQSQKDAERKKNGGRRVVERETLPDWAKEPDEQPKSEPKKADPKVTERINQQLKALRGRSKPENIGGNNV